MKKLLALILCVCMLVCLLMACDKTNTPGNTDTPTTPSGNGGGNGEGDATGLKLSQYKIIFPKKASSTVKNVAEDLADSIQLLVDDEVKISNDEETLASADAKEILIGYTNRDESHEYYTKVDFKYNVFQSGNKILLAGGNDALTIEAVEYFIETYVDESDDGTIPTIEAYEGKWEKQIVLAKGGSSDFRIVRQRSDVDINKYVGNVTNTLVEKIKNRTGVTLSAFYAQDAYQGGVKEIMIGRYPYAQLNGKYDSLQLGGYMISVIDNKLLFAATTEMAYNVAVLELDKILSAYALYGTKDVALPVGLLKSNEGIELLKNLPMPNTVLKKIIEAGNDSHLAIFAGATPAIFNDYCNALKNAGYTEYSKTNFDGPKDTMKNYFATYVSEDRTVDVGFYEYDDTMNVSVSPKGALTLPLKSEPTYTPVNSATYPVILTQVGTADLYGSGIENGTYKGEVAACYIVRLADGSFIVYDTSMYYSERGNVAVEIYKILRKQAPDPNNIVISAFVLTHPHLDHMHGFTEFARVYGKDTAVTIKQVVYNFPSRNLVFGQDATNVTSVETAIKMIRSPLEIVKPRSGNVLYYPGVKFNVVFTQEDYLSLANNFSKPSAGNASCLVMQMVTNEGMKVLFGGDHWVTECGSYLKHRYGTFIKSYVCTLFHHGQGGGAEDSWPDGGWETGIYAAAIQPTLGLCPSSYNAISTAGGVDQRGVERNVWFALVDETTKDSCIEMTVTKDSSRSKQIFKVNKWNPVEDANPNGVRGWILADEGIQIVKFIGDNDASVQMFPTRTLYYNSNS